MESPCWHTYPVPEDTNNLTLVRGPVCVTSNIALNAILHCLKYERFCYFIADADDTTFDRLRPFDSCSISIDCAGLFMPMHASSPDRIVDRIKQIGRPENSQRASLIVVRIPSGSSFHGIVNILGYLQDTQIRKKPTCLLLQNQQDEPLQSNIRQFYNVKVYDAFEWGLRRDGEEIYLQTNDT